MKWKEAKKELLQNSDFVSELLKNEFENQLISEFIQARINNKMTQTELA